MDGGRGAYGSLVAGQEHCEGSKDRALVAAWLCPESTHAVPATPADTVRPADRGVCHDAGIGSLAERDVSLSLFLSAFQNCRPYTAVRSGPAETHHTTEHKNILRSTIVLYTTTRLPWGRSDILPSDCFAGPRTESPGRPNNNSPPVRHRVILLFVLISLPVWLVLGLLAPLWGTLVSLISSSNNYDKATEYAHNFTTLCVLVASRKSLRPAAPHLPVYPGFGWRPTTVAAFQPGEPAKPGTFDKTHHQQAVLHCKGSLYVTKPIQSTIRSPP